MNKDDEQLVRHRGIPPLTPEVRAELDELAASDAPIDTSDIPELDDRFFKYGVRNPFHPANQGRLKVWLDADVSAWLEASDRNVHEHASALLRGLMEQATRRAAE